MLAKLSWSTAADQSPTFASFIDTPLPLLTSRARLKVAVKRRPKAGRSHRSGFQSDAYGGLLPPLTNGTSTLTHMG